MVGRLYATILEQPYELIRNLTIGCSLILDVGCGPRRRVVFDSTVEVVAVDVHAPYLVQRRQSATGDALVRSSGTALPFRTASFDCALALDVVEHLTKPDGYVLIEEMMRVSRGSTILLTPRGFLPQKEYDENTLQQHLSGWNARDFEELGFDVLGTQGISLGGKRLPRGDGIAFNKPGRILSLTGKLCSAVIEKLPGVAHHLVAVRSQLRPIGIEME